MVEKTLSDLFLAQLKDIYYAEKKIFRTLPKMVKAAQVSMSTIRPIISGRRTTSALTCLRPGWPSAGPTRLGTGWAAGIAGAAASIGAATTSTSIAR
jgi:Domain of unknown function (DUF892)